MSGDEGLSTDKMKIKIFESADLETNKNYKQSNNKTPKLCNCLDH